MKKRLIISTAALFMLIVALLAFSSCSKSANENLKTEKNDSLNKNLEVTSVDDKNLTETDEDLTSVDYKEFYDQLSPHGEWVQVKPEEIGLSPGTAMNIDGGKKGFSLSNLLIKDAYAETFEGAAMVYVWKPSTDLAVVRAAGEAPVYVPYTNGQWINSDAGWYFKAPTPVEETTSHYGRWVNSPSAGWLWVPGRVWAPAWVDWKQNDQYVSWAPLPPSSYISNGTMVTPVIQDNNYIVVDRSHFLEPQVYKYDNVYYDKTPNVLVSSLAGLTGLVVADNVIINRGPDVNVMQTIYGRNIELVRIQHVRTFKEIMYNQNEYFVYNPGFKRYKSKDHTWFTVNEPKSYRKYVKEEWKERKHEEKEFRKEDKEYRKENNGNDDKKKYFENDKRKKYEGDDSEMKHGKKEKGNGNDGNDKGNKHEGNDKGKKHEGNDKGNKHEGNDKGNKDGGNDKGNKHDGNGKGKK